jgi:hypothetical protein
MAKLSVECVVCDTKDSFVDLKALQNARWVTLAWNMNENVPVVTCPKCDYPSAVKKKKP